MKFIVELHLDGYELEEEHAKACRDFIYDQLSMTASCVEITETPSEPTPQPAQVCRECNGLMSEFPLGSCTTPHTETPSEPAAESWRDESDPSGDIKQASADEADKAYIKFTQRFGKSSLEMAIAWHESWRAAIEFVRKK